MNIIVAVDNNWGIGFKNQLLCSIPEDRKQFKEKTEGATIFMGRKTLESLPGGNPLKNRRNIVLTRDLNFKKDNVEVAYNREDLFSLIQSDPTEKVFCIGGGSLFQQMFSYADTCFITKIDHEFKADTYFPNLDKYPTWDLVEESDWKEFEGLKYSFQVWKR